VCVCVCGALSPHNTVQYRLFTSIHQYSPVCFFTNILRNKKVLNCHYFPKLLEVT